MRLSALTDHLDEFPPMYITLQAGLGVKYENTSDRPAARGSAPKTIDNNASIEAFMTMFPTGELRNG